MPDRPDRRWTARRMAPAAGRPVPPPPAPWADRLGRPPADPLAALKAERPEADGVRAALVARVRQLIAAGHYDDPAHGWAEAERRAVDRADAGL